MHSRLAIFAILTLVAGCRLASGIRRSPRSRTPAGPEIVLLALRLGPGLLANAFADGRRRAWARRSPAGSGAPAGARRPARSAPTSANYLQAKPDAMDVRMQYAEILAGLKKYAEANQEFEEFLAVAQDCKQSVAATIVHAHRRLMEMAEEANDPYREHLHRGIGLYLLAYRRAQLSAEDEELPAEALLCKAAAELTLANECNPDEARACWYLFEVWSQLGQRHPALARLRQARSRAAFSYMTPAESRCLQLACMQTLTD